MEKPFKKTVIIDGTNYDIDVNVPIPANVRTVNSQNIKLAKKMNHLDSRLFPTYSRAHSFGQSLKKASKDFDYISRKQSSSKKYRVWKIDKTIETVDQVITRIKNAGGK